MILILFLLVLWCRHSVPAADWYAQHLYPVISKVLSWIASPVGISLTEIVIFILILTFIRRVFRIFKDRERWKRNLWHAVRLLLWVYVWFYGAWGLNYSRSDIYTRLGAAATPYEEAEFQEFLTEFSEQLNANWCRADEVDPDAIEQEVKAWYGNLPAEAGLCRPHSWQHPKRPLFNRLYSAVGVLGFIGPAFDEMHLNRDLTPLEYPFVFAHEYSHVLGVSGEAEANFWAFEASRASASQAVRYSAWYMLLNYSWRNISSLLGEEAFQDWTATLRPEILEDMQRTRDYWQDFRWEGLAKVQKRWYDTFLRGNHIADGTKNYGQVLRLVLTFSDFHDHEHGEEG